MLLAICDEIPDASAETLGGKGFGLYTMQRQGINVPPALIIPTEVCVQYMTSPKTVMELVTKQLPMIQKFFTDKMGHMPLLSVRSGARISMPGMMDTLLNVGMDDTTEALWVNKLGTECWLDSMGRLITMYGSVVHELERKEFDERRQVEEKLSLYQQKVGTPFPTTKQQILGSIEAVFKSWNNPRAKFYRKEKGISDDWGTAVVLQAMVFGNFNDQSGSGVLFTRNPDTGKDGVVGEFLINAQGEDVVAGIRTPMNLKEMPAWNKKVSDELLAIVDKLEKSLGDVQDVEFTVQDAKVYILQTRRAARTPRAAIKIALDMHMEGTLTALDAVKRVTARQFDMAQQPVLAPTFKTSPDFTGLSACSGVVSGVPVFTAADAIKSKGPCILITDETTPDDIQGMFKAVGVVTMNGGATSHAAVVARGANKPCIVGVGKKTEDFKDAAKISMCGATGRIWLSEVPIISPKADSLIAEFNKLLMKAVPHVPIITAIPEVKMAAGYIDLSEWVLQPEDAAIIMQKTSAKVKRLFVDVRVAFNEFEKLHFGMYMDPNMDYEMQLIAAIDPTLYPEVTFLTSKKLKSSIKTVTYVNDMAALVLAPSNFVLGIEMDAAVEKVLKWKAKEGAKPMVLGHFVHDSESFLPSSKLMALMG